MEQPVRVLPGEAPKRSSNTCLIGCIGSIVVATLLVVVIAVAIMYGFGQLRDRLTSDMPEALPPVTVNEAQAQEVQQRVRAFEQALHAETPTPAVLEMTAEDLNVLLHSDPRFSAAANSVYVDIQGDTLVAQVSMPMDMVPGMAGRWLNGSAALDVDVVNDQFVVSVDNFTVHGVAFPSQALAQLQAELNKNLNQEAQVRALAARIESITVQDGRVRVTLEGGPQ